MTLVLPMPNFYQSPVCNLTVDEKHGSDLYTSWGHRDLNTNFNNRGFLPLSNSVPAVDTGQHPNYRYQLPQQSCEKPVQRKPTINMGMKRKIDTDDDYIEYDRPRKISPLWNTPKQRKDERKRILKISVQKLRAIEDPETFLRRSVLVNNTMKKLQQEIREERLKKSLGLHYIYEERFLRPRMPLGYDILNNSYLTQPVFEDNLDCSDCDKLMDDSADNLLRSLKPSDSCTESITSNIDTQSKRIPNGQQTNSNGLPRINEQCKTCASKSLCDKCKDNNSVNPASGVTNNQDINNVNINNANNRTIDNCNPSTLKCYNNSNTLMYQQQHCVRIGSDNLCSDCTCSECERCRFLAEKAISVEMDNVFNSLISALADS
ncbi:uncharacterized protein LOC141912463 [Tubulanus polymorphus]|uniref:uncharacterized protein LOC141912463 n=1 Tax=Tubulanus polymorphus TaxID=672921 RepID=UPI003DA371D6